MGTIYRQKNSKFWWIKYYRNGKPYHESSKSVKETEAKRLLRLREGEIAAGKLPGVYFGGWPRQLCCLGAPAQEVLQKSCADLNYLHEQAIDI